MADEQTITKPVDESCNDETVKAEATAKIIAKRAEVKAKAIARKEPLGLPKGTVRAITMWMILLLVFAMYFFSFQVPGEFVALTIFIVKQYYDDRVTENNKQ
jgi:hypothetical protein